MVFAATLDGPSIPWVELIPILSLLAGTCFLLLVGSLVPTWPRRGYAWVTGISTTVALVANAVKWNNLYYNKGATYFADVIAIDRFSVLASITICLAVIFGALMMSAYLVRMNADGPELYALLLTSAIGALVMVAANELIVLFLGLEILSLSLYLLAASNRDREQSQESGLKYFILGGFSSAFFLYGVALIFGSTGSTKISGIGQVLSGSISIGNSDAMLLVGIGMLLVGLGFKVSATPFHVWTPDVYEGAPTPVTASDGEAPWTAAELKTIRTEIAKDLARLQRELAVVEAEMNELISDSGEGAGDDQADAGTKTFEREHEMSLVYNARDMVQQTERALDRIENKSYGKCEECGNFVGKARLQVFPRATLCMVCKQKEERR